MGSLARGAPPPGVSVEPTPAWVERSPINEQATEGAGLAYLLVDGQTRAVRGQLARYGRLVVRITSETGVQELGQLQFTFDPAHQRLVLHEVTVRRGGETRSHLDASAVRLLQRETRLEDAMVNGLQTALLVLPDLRVGDVVEYATSVVGADPVLGGHVTGWFDLAFLSPVGAASQRIVTDRTLGFRRFAGAPPPTIREAGGLTIYQWRAESAAPIQVPADTPSDEVPFASVQYSDFATWGEVAAWAGKLYAPVVRLPPPVAKLAAEIAAREPTPEGRTRAALRLVQEEVRYFSSALGQSGYAPAAPDVVLERRFGDCKDKSLLLASLLVALGVPARVALVRSDGGEVLPLLHPTLGVFDHAIVVARVGPSVRFLDPTVTQQRGDLDELLAPAVRYALIADAGESSLTKVVRPKPPRPLVQMEQRYGVAAMGQPVTLELRTLYRGASANWFRASRAATQEQALVQQRLEWVRQTHADAVAVDPPTFTDDTARNEIVVRSTYRLPDPWKRVDGRISLAVGPMLLRAIFPTVTEDRTVPVALHDTTWVVNQLFLDLPELDWNIAPATLSLDEPLLQYRYDSSVSGRHVKVVHDLQLQHGRIEVADLRRYAATFDKIGEYFNYEISEPLARPAPPGTNWMLVILMGVWSLIVVAACVVVHRRAPFLPRPNIAYDASLDGLGGWLALLGLAMVFSMLRLAKELTGLEPLLSTATWQALTIPGGEAYHPMYLPILLFEMLGNTTMTWAGLFVVVLYFQRHRSFPLVFVIVHSTWAVFLCADMVLAGMIPAASSSQPEANLSPVGGSILWIIYVLVSRRVRSTFLPR